MPSPYLSDHLKSREPSDIRIAGMKFSARQDATQAVNVAVGNVCLPMHPAMIERMRNLGAARSPFYDGIVKYTPTVGENETRQAFLHIIGSSGFPTDDLHCQITDGGSQGMELVILSTCGDVDGVERPLLLIDAAYTNYQAFASRLRIPTISVTRTLQDDGTFSLPSAAELDEVIRRHRPGAMVIIPYDNPTGQFYDQATLASLGRLCVEHNLWMVSDEAYRELFYTGGRTSSVWGLTESDVPGISGRRISLETASKVWNACGLRIGAMVTDNLEFHTRCVAENTASLCSSAIGQYIFGALAEVAHEDLRTWYQKQRGYYQRMMQGFTDDILSALPDLIVSRPDAALYSVVDVRRFARPGFDSLDFVLYCASEGAVEQDGGRWTILTAPLAGSYQCRPGVPNPGKTQVRIAYVEPPDRMDRAPALLSDLLEQYEGRRSKTLVQA